MPDTAIAFTPYAAPDLTGLRAGQLVDYAGTLYDVRSVEVSESLGGRDPNDGGPLAIRTEVDVKLERAFWLDEPRLPKFEAPADVLVLPQLHGERTIMINGQGYWLSMLDMVSSWPHSFRPAKNAEAEVPGSIRLQLVRNPLADEENDRG